MNNVIEIKNLTKKYFNKTALDSISLNIEKGKIYGLLGPNGSGKTTLMKVLAGLHSKTSGEVLIKGNELSYKTKKDVVYMPTDDYLYQWMKAKTLVNFFNDMYEDFNSKKAIELIQELGLNKNNKVSELSTGLKSRLKVALAFSRDAEIYMFDEPLNGIDPISREKIMNLITNSFNEKKSILVSSHLVSELETCLDEVIFIKDGIIELQGNAEKIRTEKGKSVVDLYKEVFSQC